MTPPPGEVGPDLVARQKALVERYENGRKKLNEILETNLDTVKAKLEESGRTHVGATGLEYLIVDKGLVHTVYGVGDELVASGGENLLGIYPAKLEGDKLVVEWDGKAGRQEYPLGDGIRADERTTDGLVIMLSDQPHKLSESGCIERGRIGVLNDYQASENGADLMERLSAGLDKAAGVR